MNSMYKLHTKCRACKSENLTQVADFGIVPLANDFATRVSKDNSNYAPLNVLLCEECHLAQLSVVVDPRLLYSTYSYITSSSKTMQDHFDKFIDMLRKHGSKLGNVLEIGSNDGRFLKTISGVDGVNSVLGVDPAKNLAAIAEENNIQTYCDVFSRQSAEQINRLFDTVVARHVFCHVDDWHDFVRGLEVVTHKDSIVAIEVPYVERMLENVEFDTIYHEHLSYLNLQAVDALLKDSQFHISDVVSFDIHGGVIVIILMKNESGYPVNPRIDSMIDDEDLTKERWLRFKSDADTLVYNLKDAVYGYKRNELKVAGYGASAKSTNWISACKFDGYYLDYVIDNTPYKQGRFCPGTDIPIFGTAPYPVDYMILFAWNYEQEVLKKEQAYRDKGGKFIIPLPSLRVV